MCNYDVITRYSFNKTLFTQTHILYVTSVIFGNVSSETALQEHRVGHLNFVSSLILRSWCWSLMTSSGASVRLPRPDAFVPPPRANDLSHLASWRTRDDHSATLLSFSISDRRCHFAFFSGCLARPPFYFRPSNRRVYHLHLQQIAMILKYLLRFIYCITCTYMMLFLITYIM